MKNTNLFTRTLFAFAAIMLMQILFESCKKGAPVPSNSNELHDVSITVLDPTGQPLGGAKVFVKDFGENAPKTSGYTNAQGIARIKSPAGHQTIVAKIGSVFYAEQTVNVSIQNTTVPPPIKITQSTTQKVLVVLASAEQLEQVLTIIGFMQYDSIQIINLRSMAANDSVATLQYLEQYTLIFSDCNGGDEVGYPLLARIYGRYLGQGGKIYGGHYNYYNLQTIFPSYYVNEEFNSGDSLAIIDAKLISYVGFTSALWPLDVDNRPFNTFQQFRDVPPSSKIYSVMDNTTIPLIVENYLQNGKYLYTIYHNQNIKNDPQLIKIVKYFLYSL